MKQKRKKERKKKKNWEQFVEKERKETRGQEEILSRYD